MKISRYIDKCFGVSYNSENSDAKRSSIYYCFQRVRDSGNGSVCTGKGHRVTGLQNPGGTADYISSS